VKQKTTFLESEGDAWLQRNAGALRSRTLPGSDPVLSEVLDLPLQNGKARILEIGCGDGARLEWLRENRGFVCSGLDPSGQAIAIAKARGIDAHVGTADRLPFDRHAFDVVIFGFCLYLCDREDLFLIASEADRLLADPGWLLIQDFYSPVPVKQEYHHRAGLFSYKMDYRALFTWHPSYAEVSHRVRHHAEDCHTDDRSEWVSTSVLRKSGNGGG
jgi:SAM-dependent methyltransferase